MYHEEECSHRSKSCMIEAIKKKYSFINLEKHVDDCIAQCKQCTVNNKEHRKDSTFINTLYKNQIAACDVYLTDMQNTYLTYIEYFTRKIIILPIKNKTADMIIKTLEKIWLEFGKPETLVSDSGKEFVNNIVQEYLQKNDIRHHITSVDHHQSNGRIERIHRDLNKYLRKLQVQTCKAEKLAMTNFTNTYNKTTHRGIKMSPQAAWENENEEILINCNRGNIYGKEFVKNKRETFELNDIVAVKRIAAGNKLRNMFEGKYIIIEKLNNDSYKVKNLKTNRESIRNHSNLVNITNF